MNRSQIKSQNEITTNALVIKDPCNLHRRLINVCYLLSVLRPIEMPPSATAGKGNKQRWVREEWVRQSFVRTKNKIKQETDHE